MKPKEEYTYVSGCISSGSLNRVSTLIELGGFDEKMFIDWVDYDYCKNVTLHGYSIIRVNDCSMDHEVGKAFWVNCFGKKAVYNHGPFRKYYFFRNRIYFARKYHLKPIKDWYYYRNVCVHYLLLFYEKENRIKKHKAALKGIIDGFRMEL